MTPLPSGCCDGSCPEAVSTINMISTEVDASNALTVAVDNSGAATSEKSVAIQVVDEDGAAVEDNFKLDIWFVDANDKNAQPSIAFPTVPGAAVLSRITDDDGSYTMPVSSTDPLDEWYVCVSLLGLVYIDGPLNLGV